MMKKRIEALCKMFEKEVSEYDRSELSLSKMNSYSNHIRSCVRCKTVLREDNLLENDILQIERQNEPDDSILNKLSQVIMDKIESEPQIITPSGHSPQTHRGPARKYTR